VCDGKKKKKTSDIPAMYPGASMNAAAAAAVAAAARHPVRMSPQFLYSLPGKRGEDEIWKI